MFKTSLKATIVFVGFCIASVSQAGGGGGVDGARNGLMPQKCLTGLMSDCTRSTSPIISK